MLEPMTTITIEHYTPYSIEGGQKEIGSHDIRIRKVNNSEAVTQN